MQQKHTSTNNEGRSFIPVGVRLLLPHDLGVAIAGGVRARDRRAALGRGEVASVWFGTAVAAAAGYKLICAAIGLLAQLLAEKF